MEAPESDAKSASGATPRQVRRVLVIGSPRSGTRWASAMLRECGLRVLHENIGRDGVSSSFFTFDDYWYPKQHGGLRRDFDFQVRLHQVRHPLAVISSIATRINVQWWHWQEKHTQISMDLPPIERAARAWLAFTDAADAQNPHLTYRVEDAERKWPQIRELCGIERREMPEVPSNFGALQGEKVKVTWEALGSLEWAVQAKAQRYGYEN